MRFLVAFATTEGHTAQIASWTADFLVRQGHEAHVLDTRNMFEGTPTHCYDAYILMGSLHMGKHQASLTGFVHDNLDVLSQKPSAFISASGTGSRRDAESVAKADACIDEFLAETGWKPSARTPIGGAILYTKYNFLIRLVMKKISEKEGGPTDTSQDWELTDWDFLAGFLRKFVAEHALAAVR